MSSWLLTCSKSPLSFSGSQSPRISGHPQWKSYDYLPGFPSSTRFWPHYFSLFCQLFKYIILNSTFIILIEVDPNNLTSITKNRNSLSHFLYHSLHTRSYLSNLKILKGKKKSLFYLCACFSSQPHFSKKRLKVSVYIFIFPSLFNPIGFPSIIAQKLL